MKALISGWIGYYTVFSSQGSAIFWLPCQKTGRTTRNIVGPDGAHEKSRKQEGKGRVQLLKE